jgi:Raf kinase inhibitor-like YbhB/YbcL family protein
MRKLGVTLAVAGGFAFASWCCAGPAAAADFTLSSSAFKDGGWLQQKNAGADKERNPNCLGQNVSPPLAWSNVPNDTKSLALIMVDPEGRGGTGVIHWVAYGIPVSVTGFAENEVSKPSPKYVGGMGTAKKGIYLGPCTPAGPPHHYTFTLIATTLDPKELPPGLTRDQLFEKLKGKTKSATGLIALWQKK